MCGYCVLTGATAAGEAAAFVGGPLAYAAYRMARRKLGLPDTAVAPVPPRPPETREPAAASPPGMLATLAAAKV